MLLCTLYIAVSAACDNQQKMHYVKFCNGSENKQVTIYVHRVQGHQDLFLVYTTKFGQISKPFYLCIPRLTGNETV